MYHKPLTMIIAAPPPPIHSSLCTQYWLHETQTLLYNHPQSSFQKRKKLELWKQGLFVSRWGWKYIEKITKQFQAQCARAIRTRMWGRIYAFWFYWKKWERSCVILSLISHSRTMRGMFKYLCLKLYSAWLAFQFLRRRMNTMRKSANICILLLHSKFSFERNENDDFKPNLPPADNECVTNLGLFPSLLLLAITRILPKLLQMICHFTGNQRTIGHKSRTKTHKWIQIYNLTKWTDNGTTLHDQVTNCATNCS